MTQILTKQSIKEYCLHLGFDAFGVSQPKPHTWDHFQNWIQEGFHGEMGYLEKRLPERRNPETVLGSPPVSIIVVAKNYLTVEQRSDNNAPIVSRYAWGNDYHDWMGNRGKQICEYIHEQSNGEYQARWCVDTAPLLERDFAAQAGIGWVGKHTNILSNTLGNWFFLGAILTTIPLEPDKPVKPHCGTCTKCLDSCPTNAFVSPYVLDARKCISYLTIELRGSIPRELRPLIGTRVFGCDDCLEVCPWNRFVVPTSDEEFYPRSEIKTAELLTMMNLTVENFRRWFKGSPVKRAKYQGFKRNVAVALGNTHDEKVISVLKNGLREDHPLIREHVIWAIGIIGGKQALEIIQSHREIETDSSVLQEIEYWT